MMKFLVYSVIAVIFVLGLLLGTDYFYEQKFFVAESVEKPIPKSQTVSQSKSLDIISGSDLNINDYKVLNKTPPTLLSGFDWSLPAYAAAANYSGLTAEEYHNPAVVKNSFVIVRWDEANPKQGQYDFSRFDKDLKRIIPRKVLVRLEVNSACEAPKWALQILPSSSKKSLIFWDKAYLDTTRPFIQNFAKRYAANPQIIGVQLGLADGEFTGPCDDYGNKNGWGEFWMSPAAITEAEAQFGFNPEVFETAAKANIDIYIDAFGANKNKLSFTNIGTLFTYGSGSKPYNLKLKNIAKYVLAKGVGNRDGEIENWMRYTDKIYGNIFTTMPDGSCRIDFDEDFARTIRDRYWGTENEFYGNKDYILKRHGPYQNQPYRFLISSLRALQMRRNFISISDDLMVIDHPQYKTQKFLHYLTKVMGKQIENTPDVFVLMGERYITAYRLADQKDAACVKNNGDKIPVRSFGRWLTESGNSKPAVKIEMPESENYWGQKYYLPDGVDYEYFARESQQFNFDVNDQLAKMRCTEGCEVEIKATFKDSIKTSLNAVVAEGRSQTLETQGDNQIKTVTFKMKSTFMNQIVSSDLIIMSGQGPIPLILLRLNFL